MKPWYLNYTSEDDIVYCDDEDFVVYKDTDGKYVAIGNYFGGLGCYDTLPEAKNKRVEYYEWAVAMDAN